MAAEASREPAASARPARPAGALRGRSSIGARTPQSQGRLDPKRVPPPPQEIPQSLCCPVYDVTAQSSERHSISDVCRL